MTFFRHDKDVPLHKSYQKPTHKDSEDLGFLFSRTVISPNLLKGFVSAHRSPAGEVYPSGMYSKATFLHSVWSQLLSIKWEAAIYLHSPMNGLFHKCRSWYYLSVFQVSYFSVFSTFSCWFLVGVCLLAIRCVEAHFPHVTPSCFVLVGAYWHLYYVLWAFHELCYVCCSELIVIVRPCTGLLFVVEHSPTLWC